MLVFENGSGTYIAKVADFGFSTYFQVEQDLVKIPKSVPWNAPEHHGRHFYPQGAKAMDVYSFGMLCLWLLFGVESPKTMSLPLRTVNDSQSFSFEAQDWSQKEDLLLAWKRDRLLELAIQLVAEHGNFATKMRGNLTRFFQSSLCFDPQMRIVDWDRLLSFLAPAR